MPAAPPQAHDDAVAVAPAPPGRVRDGVREALEAVGWRDRLAGEGRVLVKPNLGFDLYRAGAVTSAEVLAAVVGLLVDEGHEVVIIEADQALVDIERAARTAGVPELCARPGVRWLNLSREPFVDRQLPGARALSPLRLPEIIGRHPLITVPVMKTHAKTTISGALKNQWGLLPLDRYRHHPHLHEAIAELLRAAPPSLCLMDATTCMEGDGPKAGLPRRLDLVLAARDPLRLDWLAAEIMGFDPTKVEHLVRCAPAGFAGRDAIRVVGALPRVPPFRAPSHNLVSRVEDTLQRHRGTRWVFDSPLMPLLCGGARGWYAIWHKVLAR
jgi:uncharacterized protein (DUF362 family)